MSARLLLAQELVKLDRLEEADAELARVVESNPTNEDALLARIRIFLQRKQYASALQVAEKGHAHSPRNGRTIAMLAYLLAASPQVDLRDGARALSLAQSVYAATADANHGALVALALAELGRCDEAAALTRRIINQASGAEQPDLVEKLKDELKRYEHARPCRAAAEIKPAK